MRAIYTLGVIGLLTAAASTAKANMIVNPSLASSAPPSGLIYLSNTINGSAMGPWAISKGTVDVVTSSYWQMPEGVQYSVDLIGTPNKTGSPGPGGIEQIVQSTVAGTEYILSWDFTVNPERPTIPGAFPGEADDTKVMKITALGDDGEVLKTKTVFLTRGTRTRTNMQWATDSFSFTADGPTKIVFEAMDPLNMPAGMTAFDAYTGPVVANIALDPKGGTDNPPEGGSIPEPASLAMLGFGGTLLLRRRVRA
jgi:hypothetical protein